MNNFFILQGNSLKFKIWRYILDYILKHKYLSKVHFLRIDQELSFLTER